jgi:hypothetical protein
LKKLPEGESEETERVLKANGLGGSKVGPEGGAPFLFALDAGKKVEWPDLCKVFTEPHGSGVANHNDEGWMA